MTNQEIYDFIIDYQKQQKIEQKQRELANAEYSLDIAKGYVVSCIERIKKGKGVNKRHFEESQNNFISSFNDIEYLKDSIERLKDGRETL